MKKLITIMATAATALFAFGADDGFISGTSLEALGVGALPTDKDDAGVSDSNCYWFLDGEVDVLDVTNYESGVTLPPRPAQFDGQSNDKYLKIETSGRLYRSIGVNDQTLDFPNKASIGDGIYLDTLVQFTPADSQFKDGDIAVGDKLAISYVESEDDSYTNFVVRAAYVDAANQKIVATNYFLTFPDQAADEVQFDKTKWHRLTVRAISDVGNPFAPVGFVVYVDGTNLVYKASVSGGSTAAGDAAYVESLNSIVSTYLYNNATHALLPSLLRYGETDYNVLSAVAFKGSGSVDDIAFTTNKPDILPVEGTTVTIAWDAGVATYTVVAGETTLVDGEVVSEAGSRDLLIPAGTETITVTATYAEDYEAGTWTTSAGTLSNGEWTDFESGATLTINSMLPQFEVNGVKYESFEDALAAATGATAESRGTVKLLADYTGDLEVKDGYVLIDLAGKTITASVDGAIINSGADLEITNSTDVVGHVVAGTADQAVLLGGGTTVIYGGWYDGEIYDDGAQSWALLGGYFLDPNQAEDVEDFAYASQVPDGTSITYYGSYYFQVGGSTPEPPAPTLIQVPTADTTLVYDGNELTGVATGEGYTLGGTYAATNAGDYTATATPDTGYAWSDGTTHTTNISWSIAKATVTATVSLTTTEATYDSTKTTVTDYTTPSLTFGLGAPDLVENTDYTVGWSATEVSGAGTFTYTVSPVAGSNYTFTEASVTLTITEGGSYPSYIPEDAAVKAKYDTWATTYGADTGSAYEDAFLLNIAPDAVDQTLEPTSITISGGKIVIDANKDLDDVNGKVYIKTSATVSGLATAPWSEATVNASGEIEMTPNGTAAFFKIKVDFTAGNP